MFFFIFIIYYYYLLFYYYSSGDDLAAFSGEVAGCNQLNTSCFTKRIGETIVAAVCNNIPSTHEITEYSYPFVDHVK